MPKPKPAPLSEGLLSVAKGEAMPAPEPGQARPRRPAERRISMTFRLRVADYEFLRRAAFDARTSQQAMVDEALELLAAKHHGRTAA
jgi:hypothetical protein